MFLNMEKYLDMSNKTLTFALVILNTIFLP